MGLCHASGRGSTWFSFSFWQSAMNWQLSRSRNGAMIRWQEGGGLSQPSANHFDTFHDASILHNEAAISEIALPASSLHEKTQGMDGFNPLSSHH